MELRTVFEGVPTLRELPPNLRNTEVRGLAYDSRQAAPGYIFFAFPGAKTDGAQYAASAVEKGALAIVSDRPSHAFAKIPWLQVPHGRGGAQLFSQT